MPDNILVLHSYHAELSWTKQGKEGIDQGFANGDRNVQVFHEFLDLKRYPQAQHQETFFAYLADKYRETSIDLLMVSDDPGLNLVLRNRSSIWPEVPLVFLGINHVRDSLINQPGEHVIL